MKTYVINLTIQEKLYASYIIEAYNIIQAKSKCKKAFMRDYPGADFKYITMALDNPTADKLKEIYDIIRKEYK